MPNLSSSARASSNLSGAACIAYLDNYYIYYYTFDIDVPAGWRSRERYFWSKRRFMEATPAAPCRTAVVSKSTHAFVKLMNDAILSWTRWDRHAKALAGCDQIKVSAPWTLTDVPLRIRDLHFKPRRSSTQHGRDARATTAALTLEAAHLYYSCTTAVYTLTRSYCNVVYTDSVSNIRNLLEKLYTTVIGYYDGLFLCGQRDREGCNTIQHTELKHIHIQPAEETVLKGIRSSSVLVCSAMLTRLYLGIEHTYNPTRHGTRQDRPGVGELTSRPLVPRGATGEDRRPDCRAHAMSRSIRTRCGTGSSSQIFEPASATLHLPRASRQSTTVGIAAASRWQGVAVPTFSTEEWTSNCFAARTRSQYYALLELCTFSRSGLPSSQTCSFTFVASAQVAAHMPARHRRALRAPFVPTSLRDMRVRRELAAYAPCFSSGRLPCRVPCIGPR